MERKVVVQVRLPATLVERLDRLTAEGLYGDRTEAIADSIRHLLERYTGGDKISKLVRLYLMGRVHPNASIDELSVKNPDDVRKALLNIYGTDNVDEVLRVIRGRFVG